VRTRVCFASEPGFGIIEHMENSGTVDFLLFVLWAVASLLLAWFVRRLFYVYMGSVAFSAPWIGYSMVDDGPLPMGGFIHALCAGLYVLPFYFLFQGLRKRRKESQAELPPRQNPE
jgi:hypothetical protein